MNCTHCMESAFIESNEFMSIKTFKQSLEFSSKVDANIFISGGEPTLHPDFFKFLEICEYQNLMTIVLSNGLNIDYEKILNFKNTKLQIYNDNKYYPIKVEIPKNIQNKYSSRIVFGDTINLLSPFGRAIDNKLECKRLAPPCFNIRSITRHLNNFLKAIPHLRLNGKFCTPSIDFEGNILAGESRFCHKIGTVNDSNETLTKNILNMHCNKCKLEDKLSQEQINAIY